MSVMKKSDVLTLPYMLAGLLYSPAANARESIDSILKRKWRCLRSLALCLEDSVVDSALQTAEERLLRTLAERQQEIEAMEDFPLLFIRVRSPEHMQSIHCALGPLERLLCGYILPKFDLSNADAYIGNVERFNAGREAPLYIMPILESQRIAECAGRGSELLAIRSALDSVKSHVLNIRVGGNDFCNLYGLRRTVRQSIYDLGVVRDILMDILNVFSGDYVVSGPVWEYFGSASTGEWRYGLERELELDRLNGFIGKTCIHPSQLPYVYESLKVTKADFADARRILAWHSNTLAVEKSRAGDRMNELKCHGRWARRIVTLGTIYGLQKEQA